MRRERIGWPVVTAVLAVGACAAPDTVPEALPPTEPVHDRAFYVCPDDVVFSVDFLDRGARVYIRDRTVRLDRDPLDETRYSAGPVTLRVDGESAWFNEGGGASVRCQAEGGGSVWRDAVRRGVTFRAVGQEPGWLVEIDGHGRMLLLLDYGTERIEVPAAPPQRTGRGLEYRAQSAGRSIRITIEDRPCRDVMSGEAFPSTVTVSVDGRPYDGCGLRLS